MTRIYANILKDQEEYTGGPKGKPGDLATRMAVALVPLGLAKVISWDEAAYVLEALRAYDRDEDARHRRRQEIIAIGGLK